MKIKALLIILFTLFIPYISFSEGNNTEYSEEYIDDEFNDYSYGVDFISDEDVYVLENISVVEFIGEGEDSGVTEIPREVIKTIPSGNQGVTDLLKVAPGVQFSEDYKGAANAGEVKPAKVSISGANYYENLFLIDGMNNSSMLDPGSDATTPDDVEGDPQKFFISKWLIEDLTLYDSDVSAEYDGFMGGVVDVKLRKPSQKFSGNFDYRGTNSYLAKFFISDEIKEGFDKSSQSNQLYYEKHFLSMALNIPITKHGGILLSFNRNWSDIPLKNFQKWQSQTRHIESYFLKGLWHINSYSYLDVSASYSPNYGKYFLSDVKDSEYIEEGGGYFVSANYVNEYDGHKMTLHADGSYSTNNKYAPNIYKAWLASNRRPWGYDVIRNNGEEDDPLSIEGGYGSIKKTEIYFKTSFDHKIKPIKAGGIHNISYGINYQFSRGRYLRDKNAYLYQSAQKNSAVVCTYKSLIDNTCIDGEQYFAERYVTPASDTLADIHSFGMYIEEDYKIERVSIRVGLRASWDDYMNNLNFAPRVRLAVDLFNNKQTTISSGYGRYYAANIMTYKLREGRKEKYLEGRILSNSLPPELQEEGGNLSIWTPSNNTYKKSYNFRDLKTPFTDEYTVSLNQKILGSFVNLKYLYREGKDLIGQSRSVFDSSKDIAYYSYNNNGYNSYSSIQLKWQKSWKNHNIMANLTWSKSHTSNDTYDVSMDAEDLEEEVFYNGEKINAFDLPKGNYARPVVFNATYTGRFFEHLKLSVTLNYKSPYKALELVGTKDLGYTEYDPETGEAIQKTASSYEDIEYGHNFTVDLAIYWEQQLWKNHKLTIFAEVYNLFNSQNVIGKKVYSKNDYQNYELGTQLWFGVTYDF